MWTKSDLENAIECASERRIDKIIEKLANGALSDGYEMRREKERVELYYEMVKSRANFRGSR